MRGVDVLGAALAPADEHEAVAVEHHDAGAGAVGQGFVRGAFATLRLDFALIATMVIGTSTKPRPSTFLAHSAMRAMVAGCAVARPTAAPLSRAIISRRASARSISTGVGTASSTRSVLAKGRLWLPAIWPATLRGDEPSST